MSFFKKIVLFLLVLPLFFTVSSFLFKENAHASTQYIRFTSFEDQNSDAFWNGKGRTNGEDCKSGATVKINTATGTKTTTCSGDQEVVFMTTALKVVASAVAPNGYDITGLWIKDDAHPTGLSVKNVKLLEVKGNASVYVGLKNKPAKPKITVEYVLVDVNGNLNKETAERCYVNALTLKFGSATPAWGNRNLLCNNDGYFVKEHDGSTNVGINLPTGSGYTVAGLSYSDTDSQGNLVKKPGQSGQTLSGNARIRFYVKPKSTANCNVKPELTTPNISGTPGNGFITYSMTLINKDDAGCDPTPFDLAAITPNKATWKTEFQDRDGVKMTSPKLTLNTSTGRAFRLVVDAPSGTTGNNQVKVVAGGSGVNSDSIDLKYFVNNQSKTFTFTGYPFIDNNGDGIRNGSDTCYKGEYKINLDRDSKSFTNNENITCLSFSISKTTSTTPVTLSLTKVIGYDNTKISYQPSSNPTTRTADYPSINFSENATVWFGIKPATTATRDLVITAFNFPGGVDTGTSDPTIKIKNIGNTNITGSFVVRVENKQNGTGTGRSYTVNGLAANTTEPLDLSSHFTNMPRPSAGNYTALATVDSGSAISESNENNNTKTDAYITTRPSSNPTNTPTPTNRPNPTCDKNAPTLEITPANRNGAPGDEKTYNVKVINNDRGAGCDPVTFVLSKERLPNDNWTGKFDDNTLNNIPKNGGDKTTKLHVKSPNGATTGPKTITVGVRRQGQERAQKTVNVTYTVQTSGTPTNTPTPTNSPICETHTPEFIVNPTSINAEPEEEADYGIEVTNTDTGSCPKKSMSLTADLPDSNWARFFGKENFELFPGGKQITNVRIKSPANTPTGSYKITLNLRDSSDQIVGVKEVYYVVGEVPTPTFTITPTITLTPTPTPEPTTPTPTIFPGNGLLNVVVGIDGIGSTPRIPTRKDEHGKDLGGNTNPLNKNRNLTLSIYSAATNTLTEAWNDWTFTYNPTSQKFENELALSNDFPTGIYNVYIEGKGYIRARFPGSVTITKGETTNIHSDNFYVITGNLNNEDTSENRIDIMDYMVLTSCYIYSRDYSLCDQNPNYKDLSDLNGDGIINEDDYTLFLIEYGNEGAPLP